MRCGFEPADHTIDEVQNKLELSEVLEEVERANFPKKEGGKENPKENKTDPKKKGGKKHKKGSDDPKDGGEFDEPPCMLCKLFGGNARSHATSKCNKKAKIKNGLDKAYPKNDKKKRYSVSSEEINAIVVKRAKKLLKRKFKKGGIDYASSTSESSDN